MTSEDSRNVISSVVLQDGPTQPDLLDGLMTAPCGPDHAHASPTAARASGSATPTNATYGLSSSDLSRLAARNASLANRLQVLLGTAGSTEYHQIWRKRATPAGLSYWEHTASAHRISGKDYTGWPTSQSKGPVMVGWATPRAEKTSSESLESWSRRQRKGNVATMPLALQASLAGWVTPSSRDWKDTPNMATTSTNPDGTTRTRLDLLPRQAMFLYGPTRFPSHAPTGNRGVLAPEFALWLMGFPTAWAVAGMRAARCCKARATRSFRKSRLRS